jgi:hypothetical protein
MNLRCLLGKHSFGLPRVDETGATVMECLVCLRSQTARVSLASTPEQRSSLDDRRAIAIAELVAERRWAGLPTDTDDRVPRPTR